MRVGSMINEQRRRRGVVNANVFPSHPDPRRVGVAVLALPAASGATPLGDAAVSTRAPRPQWVSTPAVGQELFDGSALVSPSGRYRLLLQSDGNLVLYWRGQPLWNSGTRGDAPDHLVMQNDGNLVLYQGLDVLWDSRSGGGARSNAYYLNLQNDGSTVVYSPADKPIWTTNTDIEPGLQFGDAGLRS